MKNKIKLLFLGILGSAFLSSLILKLSNQQQNVQTQLSANLPAPNDNQNILIELEKENLIKKEDVLASVSCIGVH